MLYVSSQICHGRLIIFQPGADTDVWHDVFFVFVWACWRLVPHRSKLKNGNSCSWQQITFGTECWIFFCGKMLGKNPVFWLGYAFFLVSLTVTVGFGPVDGWFLTGPNSKLERVSASWQQITFGTECWIFFRGKRLGKSPVFWLGYAFLFGEADGGTLQIICMCFLDSFGPVDGGFLTGPKIKIEKKPFFKGQSAVLYHEYHTPCAPAQNTHHAYHFQIGSTIKITQTQSPRLQFLDWPTPPWWPFPGSIRSGGGADEED